MPAPFHLQFPQSGERLTPLALSLCFLLLAVQVLKQVKRVLLPSKPTSLPKRPYENKEDYSLVFPPSQRQLLECITNDPVIESNVDESVLAEQVLGLTDDFHLASPERFLFSGFKVEEVRSLGSFPNYALLSGVPLPTPLENFDISVAKPRPYRPLRWPYHQTMAHQKMEHDYWIELEDSYLEQLQQRRKIFSKHGTDVLQTLPGSELACKELLEMVIQFLCARYPAQFSLKGQTFRNNILNTTHNLSETDPMLFLLENVPEDFAIMLRDPKDGRYYLRAGIICGSTGWNLGGKIGLGLPSIHTPVPDYKEKMQLSLDRFFTKMHASKPIQRGAWGFEVGRHLYTPPNDPSLSIRDSQDPSRCLEDIFLRVDWQTLRRLPLSGAIIFNFKAFFTPVASLKDEPYIPSLSLKVLNEGKENLLRYKSTWHVEHVLKPALAGYERYQVENGLIDPCWQPSTLQENPFFPGWRGSWKSS